MTFSVIASFLISLISILVNAQNISDNTQEEIMDIFHVNANDFLFDNTSTFENFENSNENLTRPQLQVTIDYELPEIKDGINEDDDFEEEYQDSDNNYISLDSYTLHVPKFHPQVQSFIFKYHEKVGLRKKSGSTMYFILYAKLKF